MTAKLNRVARCAAAVLAVVAVGAGAAACDSTSGSSPSKAGARSGTNAGSGTGQDSSSTSQDGSNSSKNQTGGTAGGSQDTAQGSDQHKVKSMSEKGSRTDAVNESSAATSSRCHTSDLNFTWSKGAPDMKDDTDQQVASITLTNDGADTCTLHGFPGVRLISRTGTAWDLRRSSDTPSTMTLHPGDSTASVSISLLAIPADARDTKPFVPARIQITPPNETTHITLDWPYGGAILDQDGATDAGTFVNPVGV
ncbi:DUF4232 domain-containing protein [Streptomyces sp. NBC_00859]|uniref:DUF4232 domain-containing protein n=1 Tax=Streptomyces sp. NBC_00859 TaxID=2903682 RepID=UPI0038632740|nr:DUF4232 domain-containing protein [Streptomyces sp. NBC_00859]